MSTNEGFRSFITNPGTIFIIHYSHVPSPKWLIYLIVLSIFGLFHGEKCEIPESVISQWAKNEKFIRVFH
jgi:hypothetical protein